MEECVIIHYDSGLASCRISLTNGEWLVEEQHATGFDDENYEFSDWKTLEYFSTPADAIGYVTKNQFKWV